MIFWGGFEKRGLSFVAERFFNPLRGFQNGGYGIERGWWCNATKKSSGSPIPQECYHRHSDSEGILRIGDDRPPSFTTAFRRNAKRGDSSIRCADFRMTGTPVGEIGNGKVLRTKPIRPSFVVCPKVIWICTTMTFPKPVNTYTPS